MSIIVLNALGTSKVATRKVEIVKFNGKYYIELEEFENSDCIVELSIALASENQALKERIKILEDKLILSVKSAS
jgi:hypothetical protein